MFVEVLYFIAMLYIFLRLWYWNHTKPWKDFEQVPLPRYTLLGHIPSIIKMSDSELFRSIHLWLEDSKTDSILLWMGCRPLILTRNRLVFENVLSSSKHTAKSGNYWIFKDWLGDSIFLANGDSWRKRRKLLTPSFHFNILQDFVKTMEKHSLALVDALKTPAETGKTCNPFQIMKLYTIGTIIETAMGIESNIVKTAIEEDSKNVTVEDQKFLDMIISTDRLLDSLILREKIPWYWYKPLFKLFPTGSQFYSDLQKVKHFATSIIQKRIEDLEKAKGSDNNISDTESVVVHSSTSIEIPIYEDTSSVSGSKSDKVASTYHKKGTIFIDTLLSLYKNGDIKVEDILNESQSFIVPGYETVATALSWSLYLLGRNKTQQDKAYQEAVRVKALCLPIAECIKEMQYIKCVIKEVLRIHPSAGLIARNFGEDSQIGTQRYPKGTSMVLCINEIQRDAKNYEDPMVFKPERFLHVGDGVNNKENSRYTFVPFSAGPRNCIGQKFAMMVLQTTLFHLLLEYDVIATQKEEDLKESFGIVHGVENGLEIKLRKR